MIPYGIRYCETCAVAAEADAEEAQRKKMARYNAGRDPKYAAFYNSKAWKMLRDRVLVECAYECEMCHEAMATEVDHIVELREDWSKRYDRTNLRGVCARCHNVRHKRFISRGQGGVAAGGAPRGAEKSI